MSEPRDEPSADYHPPYQGTILPILPHPDYVHAWPDRTVTRVVKAVLVVAAVVVVVMVMR